MNANLKQAQSSTGLSSPKVGTLVGSKKASAGHVVVQIDKLYSGEKMNRKQELLAQATFGKGAATRLSNFTGLTESQGTQQSDDRETEAKSTGDRYPPQRGIKRFGSNPMVHHSTNQSIPTSPEPVSIRSVRSPTSLIEPEKASSPEISVPS